MLQTTTLSIKIITAFCNALPQPWVQSSSATQTEDNWESKAFLSIKAFPFLCLIINRTEKSENFVMSQQVHMGNKNLDVSILPPVLRHVADYNSLKWNLWYLLDLFIPDFAPLFYNIIRCAYNTVFCSIQGHHFISSFKHLLGHILRCG